MIRSNDTQRKQHRSKDQLNSGMVNNLRFTDQCLGVLTGSGTELHDITTQIDDTGRRIRPMNYCREN